MSRQDSEIHWYCTGMKMAISRTDDRGYHDHNQHERTAQYQIPGSSLPNRMSSISPISDRSSWLPCFQMTIKSTQGFRESAKAISCADSLIPELAACILSWGWFWAFATTKRIPWTCQKPCCKSFLKQISPDYARLINPKIPGDEQKKNSKSKC